MYTSDWDDNAPAGTPRTGRSLGKSMLLVYLVIGVMAVVLALVGIVIDRAMAADKRLRPVANNYDDSF